MRGWLGAGNVCHGRGPRCRLRTAEGKSRASRNAVRHGLFDASRWSTQHSDRVTQIANKLCEGDPFAYRSEAALAVADAQVLLDRIRLARAHMIATTKARPKQTRWPGMTAFSEKEFQELLSAIRRGKPRRVKQIIMAPANRLKAFVEAVLHGENALPPPSYPVPPPVPVTPEEQRLLDFRACLPNLPALDRYEQRAYARLRRAIRRFDALHDIG
jgi:hypothetical protein